MFIANMNNGQSVVVLHVMLCSSVVYLWLGCNRECNIFCLCAVNMEACAQLSFAKQQQASPHGV